MPNGSQGFSFVVAALLVVLGVGQMRDVAPAAKKAAASQEPRSGAVPVAPAAPAAPVAPSTPESAVASALPAPDKIACSLVVNPPQPKPEPACNEGNAVLANYAELYQRPGRPTRWEFLVALVPDPEESGYTDYFDAVFEGVEDAVGAGVLEPGVEKGTPARRYVRDHHYFPWPGSDAEKRSQRCWEKTPGVVVYRPVDDPQTEPALAVLLVGETPTWGVRTEQLKAALKHIAEASAAPESPYRLLGPTFSGSAASLSAGLQQHARASQASSGASAGPLKFQIASGTATGNQVKPTLERARGPSLHLEYRASVPDGERLLQAMTLFLAATSTGSRHPERDTVILSESMTAYGESVSGHDQRRFPPNLASLRRAYAEVAKGDSAAVATRAPSDARVATEERSGELSEQTPISHDLALAELLRELAERNYRNIGLIATNASDVVFMAERIKRQLPDVRLFTLGFDLRYLHPDHAPSLNGMLVAHAASDGRPEASTGLKNPMTRGVSEAGRFLLSGRPVSLRTSVSLLGNGALWQIGSARGVSRREVPQAFSFVYWAALAVSGLVLLLVAGPTLIQRLRALGQRSRLPLVLMRSGFLRQRSSVWATLGNCQHLDLAADHAFASSALLTIALALPALMAAATLRQAQLAGRSGIWLLASLGVLGLLLIWWRTAGKFRAAGRSAGLLGVLVGGVACLATSLGCTEPRQATFYLLSGGSPLLVASLGLAMLMVVVWCWRARLRLLDTLRFGAGSGARFFEQLQLPITQILGKGEHSDLGELERRLVCVLRSPWSAAPLVPIVTDALLLASILFVLLTKGVTTFEAGFRHWVLVAFVTFCILPITTSFARILVTARALMRLLRATGRLPLLEALSKLPPELARRLETQLAQGGKEVGELRHATATLRRIGQALPDFAGVASECDARLEAELAYEAGAPLPTDADPEAAEHGPALLADKLLESAARLATLPRNAEQQALVEEYQARLLAIFVARYVRQLRLLVPPVLVGSLLAILMTSLYFVQPQQMIASICFVWVTAMVLGVVATYVVLARDPVISAIGKTDAGSVTPSFSLAVRVFGVTLVPLASLLASQYPEFAVRISSLLGSVARALQ